MVSIILPIPGAELRNHWSGSWECVVRPPFVSRSVFSSELVLLQSAIRPPFLRSSGTIGSTYLGHNVEKFHVVQSLSPPHIRPHTSKVAAIRSTRAISVASLQVQYFEASLLFRVYGVFTVRVNTVIGAIIWKLHALETQFITVFIALAYIESWFNTL